MNTPIFGYAIEYRAAGLSPIPVRVDGSKAPLLNGWREFATRQATDAELHHWFNNGTVAGIGIACGQASGNLVVLDIESADAWERWRNAVPVDTVDFLEDCPIVRTPRGGAHIWVRLPEPTPGTVLARKADKSVLIEVRGEGHQVLAPGCPASCHPTGRLYEFAERGWLDTKKSAPVPLSVWFEWLDIAAGLNEYTTPPTAKPTNEPRPPRDPQAKDPGTDFNIRGSWEEAGLFDTGWSWEHRFDGDRGYVRRPGKDTGTSGTIGMVTSRTTGAPLFYPFTSNAHPFEQEHTYDRFGVFARLKHAGDFKTAAKALLDLGYGERTTQSTKGATVNRDLKRQVPPVSEPEPTKERSDEAAAPVSPFTDTDIANGRRFVLDHGASVRFVVDWKSWIVFDGRRWVLDRCDVMAEALAKTTTDRMACEAASRMADAAKALAAAGSDEAKERANREVKTAKRDLDHAKKSQDMRAIRRILSAARSEAAVRVPYGRDVFDTHAHLLNCMNGTVDLRTGSLTPHRREDFITRLCPTRFNPTAERAGYLEFLGKVFDGKPALSVYVRQLSGYVATGETCDHSFHVFHGDGSNGKSVLLTLWTTVLGEGEYEHTAAPEMLVGDGKDRHPTEMVGLRGARLVVCSESKEEGRLDEPKVKKLTSTDMLSARGMGQDFFQFRPTHKLILATNHKPRIRGTDDGIRRRMRLVPFAAQFWKEADRQLHPEREFDPSFQADPKLEDRLKDTEAEGILRDMVEHAVAFYKGGKALTPPTEVTAATSEYIESEDIIGQYFKAQTKADPDGRVKAKEFHEQFKKWAVSEGHDESRLPGIKKFGAEAGKRFACKRHAGTVYLVRVFDLQP
ncbi:MAG: bifunctional DNA primase/polymerase [Planctomycetes bacterium]|nr:bifunctional DNA primase/polymerase [Planctomycetota bacterium]